MLFNSSFKIITCLLAFHYTHMCCTVLNPEYTTECNAKFSELPTISFEVFQSMINEFSFMNEVAYVVKGFPKPKRKKLVKVLLKFLPNANKSVSQSDYNIFNYHDNAQIWSSMKYYNLTPRHQYTSYDEFDIQRALGNTQRSQTSRVISQGKLFQNESNTSAKLFQYLSQKINNGSVLPTAFIKLVPWLEPVLKFNMHVNAAGGLRDVSAARIWMANVDGVIASPHYDDSFNINMQLAGTKTFLVAKSDIDVFQLFNPYPMHHPRWRQAQNWHLIDHESICQKIMSSNAINISAQSTTNLFSKIQIVMLEPGDAIYLPPGYIHSATSGKGAVSINLWITSYANVAKNNIYVKSRNILFTIGRIYTHTITENETATVDFNNKSSVVSKYMLTLARYILLVAQHELSPIKEMVPLFIASLRLRYEQLLNKNGEYYLDSHMPPIKCEADYQEILVRLSTFRHGKTLDELMDADKISSKPDTLDQTRADACNLGSNIGSGDDSGTCENSSGSSCSSTCSSGGSCSSSSADTCSRQIQLCLEDDKDLHFISESSLNILVKQAANDMNSMKWLPAGLMTQLLMDYFEVLHMEMIRQLGVIKDPLGPRAAALISPCALLDFVESCLNPLFLKLIESSGNTGTKAEIS